MRVVRTTDNNNDKQRKWSQSRNRMSGDVGKSFGQPSSSEGPFRRLKLLRGVISLENFFAAEVLRRIENSARFMYAPFIQVKLGIFDGKARLILQSYWLAFRSSEMEHPFESEIDSVR